jgi:WD40 repeat protein
MHVGHTPMHVPAKLRWIGAAVVLMAAGGSLRADVARETADPVLRLDLPGHTAEVRALAFFPGSSRLVSGGRDKVAMVWNPAVRPGESAGPLTRDIGRRRTRERVLRWQVARGTRGAIQALAVAPGERPVVAIAGSGAMGSTGEIVLIDARDGSLVAVLGGGEKPGHRNSVLALEFSADGRWLFSQDFDGQTFAWKRDDAWKPVELAAREESRYGPKRTTAAQSRPRMRPLAAVSEARVALPVLVSPEGAATELWRIELVDPASPQRRTRLSADHRGVVMAMDASPDGRFLASADLAGRVFVHDLSAGAAAPPTLNLDTAAESLALSPDGATVVLGLAAIPAKSAARFEAWHVADARRLASREMPAAVRAVAVSDDGRFAAWTGGWRHEVFVEPLADLEADRPTGVRLGGVGRPVGRVAFAMPDQAGGPPSRIAVGWSDPPAAADGSRDGAGPFHAAFDVESLALAEPPPAERIAPPGGPRGAWSLDRGAAQQPGGETWRVSRDGKPVGVIGLDIAWQGRMGPADRCIAWLREPDAVEPWAVAIGTDRGIFVYALPEGDPGPDAPLTIVRRYRGHEDGVTAIGISADGRWLASGGRDGVVMLWPLPVPGGDPLFERFGIGIAIENGRAVVSHADEAGPLAGRNVAVGDVLAKVSAPAATVGEPPREAAAGGDILAALAACAWGSQWAFFVEREGKIDDPFNRQPAWENLAAFHLADNREWAFWSPRGYYAASANGDTLFGWLVNRGVERLPRFHPARQFRRRLERPDVMSRLLAEGSLAGALRRAARDVPDSSSRVLPRMIAAAPEVRILSPEAFHSADGGALRVRATVEVPKAATLADVRAYASGVVARDGAAVVGERPLEDGGAARTYEWRLDLPAETQQLIQVFAGTADGTTAVGEITVSRPRVGAGRRPPRLHLLAAGIDRYRHADRFAADGLTDLVFATEDAEAVRDSLAAHAGPFGGLAAGTLLRDAEVTRDAWRGHLARMAETIAADVTPDDLLVIFLAGHGMNDTVRGRGYAYLCHDATFEQVGGEVVPVAESSIGWSDFAPLAALPCRKLALVDTCHAGALSPARRAATVREFQENMILVLSASADDEPSQESDAWGHGAFTKVLLEALDGAADTRGSVGRGDGIVSVDEVVEHVLAGVPSLTAAGRTAQHATVSPDGLVPYVTMPLTRR